MLIKDAFSAASDEDLWDMDKFIFGKRNINRCYRCWRRERINFEDGDINCKDPFNPDGVETLACDGPCSITYYKDKIIESWTRSCHPGCVEERDQDGYTECCDGDLCNDGDSTQTRDKTCYSCMYYVKANTKAGPPNCADPFDPSGLSTVVCNGYCATTYNSLGPQDKTWIRTCVPTWRDTKDQYGYTKTCQGSLCNTI